MQNVHLENQLIVVDIADAMLDYVALQPDIDETKIKSAEIIAQKLDIKRIIGQTNLDRCINPQIAADYELKELIIPPLCYFTYSRLLKSFQGTFTESGFMIEGEAEDKNAAKSVAAEHASIAEAFMADVINFLQAESSDNEEVKEEELTPRIRIFGGKENRASN